MNIAILTSLLFLAHFLADFVLQPFKLVKWKYHSVKGLLVHATIHFILYLALLLLILKPSSALIAAAIIAVSHGIVDRLKIIQENNHLRHFTAFWVDQLVHWFILVFVILLLVKTTLLGQDHFLENAYFPALGHLLYNPTLIGYFILVIFFGKALEISSYQISLDQNKKALFKPNLRRVLRRLFFLTLFFLVLLSVFTIF